VYYHFRKDGNEVTRCVDLESGTQKWEQSYTAPANFEYSNGPRSTPCVANDRIYTVGINGRVQCRKVSDGELVWELDFPGDLSTPPPHRGVSFSPLVEEDLVLLNPGGAGKSVIACRADTGKEVWRSGNDPVGYSSPLIATVNGQKLVIQFTGTALVGMQLRDGREVFSYPWPTAFQINATMPLLFQTRLGDKVRDYAFITTGYKQGCALLHLRPRDDGTFAVETVYKGDQLCSHFGSPVRIGDHVYGFDESRMVALNLRTGEIRWRKSGFMKGTLCVLGEDLVVFGEEGQIGIGPATPDKPFEPRLSGRVFRERTWSMPVVAQGRLLVRTEETGVCIDLRRK
jgi:outer membrane protein assembly factor BamB